MKKKLVIGISVGILVIALIVVGIVKNAGAAGSGPLFTVSAVEIKKDGVSSSISANGTVAEVEKSEVYFDTPVKVTKLYVKQNDVVKKGQKMAEFDFDDMNSKLAQAKIEKQSLELALKKLLLTDATVSVNSAQNTMKVAESAVASAQRSYDKAVKAYNDNKALIKMNAISKSELDASETALKDAEEALSNAKLKLQNEKENVSTSYKSVSTKQIDIDSQRLAIEKSALDIADQESKIKKCNDAMYAPMDGVVSLVNVSVGSLTPNNQTVFTILNPDKLEVKLKINEYNAKLVKPGQTVTITGDSIPETDKITGKVDSVSPIASTDNNNSGSSETVIQVIVSIDNITEAIKPGITVNCDINIVDLKNVLTLQLDMLGTDKDGNYFVYVISKDKQTMRKVSVKIGTTSDMKAELKSGDIKEGDLVVSNPKSTYKDGARVKLGKE